MSETWKCPKCGTQIITGQRMWTETCPNDGTFLVKESADAPVNEDSQLRLLNE